MPYEEDSALLFGRGTEDVQCCMYLQVVVKETHIRRARCTILGAVGGFRKECRVLTGGWSSKRRRLCGGAPVGDASPSARDRKTRRLRMCGLRSTISIAMFRSFCKPQITCNVIHLA